MGGRLRCWYRVRRGRVVRWVISESRRRVAGVTGFVCLINEQVKEGSSVR